MTDVELNLNAPESQQVKHDWIYLGHGSYKCETCDARKHEDSRGNIHIMEGRFEFKESE